MAKKVKICFDRILEEEQLIQWAELSVDENLTNIPIMPMALGEQGFTMPEPMELALKTSALWKPGKTLRCRFLGGDPTVQSKVEAVAHQWEQHANIKFEFGQDPDAEIRIAFIQGAGSWSYLGTEALVIPKDKPTMNYGWLKPNTSNTEYNRTVLHEFGHALGCIHEHQNPTVSIPWDKPAVYRYYGGPPNNWPPQKVDVNLFQAYSADRTQFSQFDRQSIMLYPIDNALTIGDFEVGWNTALSATDIQYIGTIYPFQKKLENELTVDGSPAEASIGKHGEEDTFQFVVGAAGAYTLETGGPTDVTMGLYGPDDPKRQIAFDDDSGKGLNARISVQLQPGIYQVRVRHYRPRGTGAYTLSLKSG
jgi:hypothetical protein